MAHRIVDTLTDHESGEEMYLDETGARYDASAWSLDDNGEWQEHQAGPSTLGVASTNRDEGNLGTSQPSLNVRAVLDEGDADDAP